MIKKIKHAMNDSLYRNSAYLFINSGIMAATGLLFWTLAARLFPAEQVGLVSTLIAAATFVASASILGLDHTLIHFLGKHPKRIKTIINTAFTTAAMGVLVVSGLYLAIVPLIAPDLSFILSSAIWIAAFFVLMLVTTWNNLLTSVFISFRATYFILIAGICFSVLRIILLPLFNGQGISGLFNAHLFAFGLGIVVSFGCLFISKRYIFTPRITKDTVRLIKGYSLRTYVASLLASIPPLVTPLFILAFLGASQVAYYNMPLMIVTLLAIIPMATSQSLFAEGVNDSADLKRHIVRAIKFIYALLIPVVVVVVVAGNWMLGLFGESYAQHGYGLLVLLSLAALFKAGSFPLIAILRVLGDIKEIIIVTVIYTVCIIAATYSAILFEDSLWAIGAAVLGAEIIALVLYVVMLRRKWPKIAVIKPAIIEEEISHV